MAYGDSYTETQDNIHSTLIKTRAPSDLQSIWRKAPTRVLLSCPGLFARLPFAFR